METTATATRQKTICFAYFGDGQFLGWYADTFGSIREGSPKLYGDKIEMVEQIAASFRQRMIDLKNPNKTKTIDADFIHPGIEILNESIEDDKSILRKYQTIELRMVECPYYDGPNPDFNEAAHKAAVEEYRKGMEKAGIFDIPPSPERSKAVNEYHAANPRPIADNWIYSDYALVKQWASTPPTEFLAVISSE